MRILLVEDDLEIMEVIYEYLELLGFTIDHAFSGPEGLELALTGEFDLIILDVMLPRLNGFEVCKKIREAHISTPILMLTARDTSQDMVTGLEIGADDYLVKPFDLKVLVARIRALNRRVGANSFASKLSFSDVEVDLQTRSISVSGELLHLSPVGYTLLKVLLEEAPNVVSRDTLSHHIWGEDPPDGDALRKHIHKLRSVLSKYNSAVKVQTLIKVGYRLTL
ncbi:response regulator transcription factor [Rhodobacteraceae bacterium RKSG542]|uniref:response regulator transcription factor n=1 Tax=Pseudovibrio flavus TaxID=2529854 RepID=UPI0012BC102B|nr:response regulator transcription factor [Pseudovibrio flavus]MTI15757.1 response regulator transcription factor [Pseudovibrio flavus]